MSVATARGEERVRHLAQRMIGHWNGPTEMLLGFLRLLNGKEPVAGSTSYQRRVDQFMLECFGAAIAGDIVERNHRYLEESLELVQALGCSEGEARMLVEYVYGRPAGEPHQEAGGAKVTLFALCSAAGLDMDRAGEDELTRVWGRIDAIREKQKNRPKGSPLPQRAELAAPSSLGTPQALKLLRRAGCQKIDGRKIGYCVRQLRRGRLVRCDACQFVMDHDDSTNAAGKNR
jgi:hypothetical protein